jgi:hypothetical protein
MLGVEELRLEAYNQGALMWEKLGFEIIENQPSEHILELARYIFTQDQSEELSLILPPSPRPISVAYDYALSQSKADELSALLPWQGIKRIA